MQDKAGPILLSASPGTARGAAQAEQGDALAAGVSLASWLTPAPPNSATEVFCTQILSISLHQACTSHEAVASTVILPAASYARHHH